jgi:small subunit ribosomal protein S20
MCAIMQKLRIIDGSVRDGIGGFVERDIVLYCFTPSGRHTPFASGNVDSWLACKGPLSDARNDTEIRNTPSRFDTTHLRKPFVANIKSQIKRIKTNLKAQERNRAVKSELKTVIRIAREAIATGDKSAAVNAVAAATRKIDKAVSKGVIHKNQAANRKSGIAAQAAALSGDAKVTKAPAKAPAKAAAKTPAKKVAAKAPAKKAPTKAAPKAAAKAPAKAAAKAPAKAPAKKAAAPKE